MVSNSSLSGAVVSLDAGMDSVSFVTQVAGSSTLFGGGAASAQTVNFSSAADLATFDGTFGGGSIMGGSGADTLVFAAGAQVASGFTLKTEAGADSLTFTNNVISGQFGTGAGADFVGGNITVGTNAVSFFSGSGNDTFNMTQVTQGGGGALLLGMRLALTASLLGVRWILVRPMSLVVRWSASVLRAVLLQTSASLPVLSVEKPQRDMEVSLVNSLSTTTLLASASLLPRSQSLSPVAAV